MKTKVRDKILRIIFLLAFLLAFFTLALGVLKQNLCSTVGGGFLMVCWLLCFIYCSDSLMEDEDER